jgi:hypothetical protein
MTTVEVERSRWVKSVLPRVAEAKILQTLSEESISPVDPKSFKRQCLMVCSPMSAPSVLAMYIHMINFKLQIYKYLLNLVHETLLK